MANPRLYYPDGEGLTRMASIYAVIPIGATGAPGAATWLSGPFAITGTASGPLTRSSAGVYTCALRELWVGGIVWYSILTIQGTIAATDGMYGTITADNTKSGASPGFGFTMVKGDGTGAAGEIRNGATLLISVGLKNNGINP